MSEQIYSKKLAVINVFFGATISILALIIYIYSTFDIEILLFLVANTLVIMGAARIINGGANKNLKNWVRLMKIITGIIAILLAIISIFIQLLSTTYAVEFLIFLFSIVLITVGFARFLRGTTAKELSVWLRILVISVGLISIILSLIIFLIPTPNYQLLIYFLTIILLFNGIARLAIGLTYVK